MFSETSVSQYLIKFAATSVTEKQGNDFSFAKTNHTVWKFTKYVEIFRSLVSEIKGMQFWYQLTQISLSAYETDNPLCNSNEKMC